MLEIIKQASIELQSFDNGEIVKIAGVLRKLKNWLGSLGNPEYKAQIENLHNESTIVSVHLENLSKHIKLLQSAIKDADVKSYEKELDEVKFLSSQLSNELVKLDNTAKLVKIPEVEVEDKAEDKVEIENKVEPVESKNRSGYDVPVGFVNKPYKSFEHFNQISADSIVINDNAKAKTLLNVSTKLKRLKLDDQIPALEEKSTTFFIVLKEAITNGVVLENIGIEDDKKERPSGQMYVKVKTAPFSVPGLNLKIQGVALLTDLYAQKSPRMKLSLMRFTDIEIEKIASASERRFLLRKLAGLVNRKVTNLSGSELADVLKNAYVKVFGEEPTLQIIGTAWAQSMAEQSGHYINNNLGNISATQDWINSGKDYWGENTTEYDANGVGKNTGMKFRSYDTIDEGAQDYWRQLGTTFKDALKWFGTGDALHSGLALGDKTYYTADRRLYSGNMASLYDTFISNVAPSLNLKNQPTLPPTNKFPEYKAHLNSEKEAIPDKYIDTIGKNTAYKLVNDNGKQYVVLNEDPAQNNTQNAENNTTEVTQNNTPPNTATNDIDSEADDLVNYLFKSSEPLHDIVKIALENILLPKNQVLISVASLNSYSDKIKYAAIVSELLEKNINASADILSDGDSVNINCIVTGEENSVINAVLAICETVSDSFYFNNCKIVKSMLKVNHFSKFAQVSFDEIERCIRKCALEEMI